MPEPEMRRETMAADQLVLPRQCETCGPQPPDKKGRPVEHTICHPGPYRRNGCGHPLKEHTPQLDCRTCGAECGRYCPDPIKRRT